MAKEITLEEAVAQIETLTSENLALKSENAELKNANSSLEAKFKENEKVVMEASKEVPGEFIHNKETFRFKKGVFHFSFKGEKHSSIEAIKNKALMKELVEIGSGCIEKI